ncbi:hypothetical protein JYQ62_18325 [Nostoc sp. UHCC 0702]|nr:hypothetical protein JYQ62_18325 [Nostoc sp. UHCC 0702]
MAAIAVKRSQFIKTLPIGSGRSRHSLEVPYSNTYLFSLSLDRCAVT